MNQRAISKQLPNPGSLKVTESVPSVHATSPREAGHSPVATEQNAETLAPFIDPDWAARFFAAIPQVAGDGQGHPTCEVVPLKLRERRGVGVILYKLRWTDPSGRVLKEVQLVGKITSSKSGTAGGEKSFATLRQLCDSGFGEGPMLVPRPIA